MTNETVGEAIGQAIVFCIVVGLLGWALVSSFPITWGQALVISWMFNKLIYSLN